MVDFIGRTVELGLLAEAFESPGSECIPIYGRRRVGKSELILKFMTDRPGVYYLGQQSSAALQVRGFLEEAAGALDIPLLAELRADNWQRALLTVVEQWTRANPGSKLALALDEFQWIAASSPDLLSTLQHCWDRHWKGAGNVVLLCGSYLGFMEREVLGKTSPLFGRRTAQIHLQPFGYPTDLGECKWGAVRSLRALEAELERKAEAFPNRRGATLGRRYFVRRKPAGKERASGWYSLDDLYAFDAAQVRA